MDATAIAPTGHDWLKAAGFTPAMASQLKMKGLVTPFALFEMDDEDFADVCHELRRTWGVGDNQVQHLKGYYAGINQMYEWLHTDL